MRARSADAAFQDMRYTQIVSDLTEISFAAVLITLVRLMTFRSAIFASFLQDDVLHAIDKRRISLLFVAQIFKRENGNSVR